MSLTDRALAAVGAEELPLEEIGPSLRAHRRDRIGLLALLTADVLAVAVAWVIVLVRAQGRPDLLERQLLRAYGRERSIREAHLRHTTHCLPATAGVRQLF